MSQHDYIIANGSGATVRGDINDVLAAIKSANSYATAPPTPVAGMLWWDISGTPDILKIYDGSSWHIFLMENVGATAPAYAVLGTVWYDTANNQFKFYTGSVWIALWNIDEAGGQAVPLSNGVPLTEGVVTFGANDATPSVSGGKSFKTANNITTLITALDDAIDGQAVRIIAMDALTSLATTLVLMDTDHSVLMAVGDTWEGVYDGTAWQQTGGSVGMGRLKLFNNPVEITSGWIAASQTTYADVDIKTSVGLATYGRANGAIIMSRMAASSGLQTLYARRKFLVIDGAQFKVHSFYGTDYPRRWHIPLINGVFQARFGASWTVTTNKAYVIGVYL